MYRVRFGNKYGAKKQEYKGVQYHSKMEAKFAVDLDWKKIAGDIKSWERQVKIPLDVHGYHICNYYIDFVVTHNDGHLEYIEVKGFETPEWQLKWKLFEALYGKKENVSLTVVK